MKRFLTSVIGAGLALSLATGASAVTFSHFETTTMPGDTVFSTSNNSSVLFLTGSDTSASADGLGTDVVLANLDLTSSSATDDAFNAPYTIIMNLTDDASSASGQLTFTGTLTGTARGGATPQANINNTFDNPQTQSITLGGVEYVVTIGPYVPPGPQGSGQRGSIGAHVTAIPEPGSLALLGAGALPLVGLLRRRK